MNNESKLNVIRLTKKIHTMKNYIIALIAISFTSLGSCSESTDILDNSKEKKSTMESKVDKKNLKDLDVAYFASGCFWCVEAVFQSVKGVEDAVSGYTGGEEKNPTYGEVSAGNTGHTEAVKVYYDSEVISYEELLTVFFDSHDPSTLNRQGPDAGTQYRSGIYYETSEQKTAIDAYIKKLEDNGTKVTTEVAEFTEFWDAEDYHQEYEALHPNNGYVKGVSVPRLNKFKEKHPELLKDGAGH